MITFRTFRRSVLLAALALALVVRPALPQTPEPADPDTWLPPECVGMNAYVAAFTEAHDALDDHMETDAPFMVMAAVASSALSDLAEERPPLAFHRAHALLLRATHYTALSLTEASLGDRAGAAFLIDLVTVLREQARAEAAAAFNHCVSHHPAHPDYQGDHPGLGPGRNGAANRA